VDRLGHRGAAGPRSPLLGVSALLPRRGEQRA